MYSFEAVRIAQPFLQGEYKNILKSIQLFPEDYKTFVVVGCGPAVYFKLSHEKNLKYIGIEPEIESFKNEIKVILENKKLGATFLKKKLENLKEVHLKKLTPPKIIVFVFNIANYISDFKNQLKKIVNPRDLIIISSWSRDNSSVAVREKYFGYLNNLLGKKDLIDCRLKIDLKKIDLTNFPYTFKSTLLKKEANSCLVLKMIG